MAVFVDSNGDIFGTANAGGTYGFGAIWEITALGTFTILHSFGGTITNADGTSGPDGWASYTPVLLDGHGNIYGSTAHGGPNSGADDTYGYGMAWEITANGIYKDLHDFGGTVTNADGSSGPDGFSPIGALYRDPSGDLFGCSTTGGPYFVNGGSSNNGGGMVWEITSTGVYKDLHDFGGTTVDANGVSGPDGQVPDGGVTADSAGNLYGTALLGGGKAAGMVWKLTNSDVYTDLHDFGGTVTNANGTSGPDGQEPQASVQFDLNGDMFGTATYGGPNTNSDGAEGMIWEITVGGAYKDVHDFGGTVTNADGKSGLDGGTPIGPLAFDLKGNLFGTTTSGGPNGGSGNGWEITTSGQYVDWHDFGGTIKYTDGTSGPDGIYALGVVTGPSGNIWGNCSQGGSEGGGMVWETGAEKDLTVTLTPSTIGGLGTATGSVILATPAPAGGLEVNLRAGASGYLNLPSSVTIPEGSTTATFTITGIAQRSATLNMGIIASDGVSHFESILTIQGDVVTSLTFSPTTIGGNGSTKATITIASAAPPGGWIVYTKAYAAGYLNMPYSVVVPADATSTTFTITGSAQRTGTSSIGVNASDGNASVVGTLTIQGDALKSISLYPTTTGWSGTSTGTITLVSAAPEGGWVVSLKAGAPGYLNMPASVTVPAGATSATFAVTATAQRSGSLTIGIIANDTGNQLEAVLTLTGDSLSEISVSPTAVNPGANSTGTINLSGPAPTGGWVVRLWSGAPTDVQVPASVTIPAGQSSATFLITTYARAVPGNYGVFANDGTAQFEAFLTVNEP